MKQQRPIGITIFALIGILYGICLLFLSVMYFVFKSVFAVFGEVSSYAYYIVSFICFVLGSCFLVSSLALLKKRLWARRLFLLTVLSNMAVEIWLFVKKMIPGTRLEVSPIGLEDVLELLVASICTLLIFWYFNRKNVRNYLTSKDLCNVAAAAPKGQATGK